MKRLSVTALSILLVSILLATPLLAGEDLPVVKTKLKSLALFKNGLGFFVRDGETALRNGWAVTEHVPMATFGALWIGALDEGASLDEVIGFSEEVRSPQTPVSLDELLRANVGKKVKLSYGNEVIEGVIKSAQEGRKVEGGPMEPSSIILVSTPSGDVALNRGSIGMVRFLDECADKVSVTRRARRLKFKISPERDKARLGMSYLSKGITWTPGYLINIENPDKARLTMQATIVNDVEDIENVDVFFVVGYPNFLFADMLSPLVQDESISEFIGNLTRDRRVPVGRASRYQNVATQAAYPAEPDEDTGTDFGYSSIQGLPGSSEEDLFLYAKKGVTLKKGERAYYHVFSDAVEYKHIYEWAIPDTLNVSSSGYSGQSSEQKPQEQVWHSLKMLNSTPYPWTTAPALVLSGSKPIAQDMVNYTPRGGRSNVKLTVATDVKTDRREYEVERQRDLKINYSIYDLVTIKGELLIRNMKDKDVVMEIRKFLTGEVMSVGNNGKITKVAEGLKGVNHNSVISWELPVKAGSKTEISYTYKVYISH